MPWRTGSKYQANGRGQSQEQLDLKALGAFHGWISKARAEAAAVQSIAKFQAAARARRA